MASPLQLIHAAPRWQAHYAWSEERGGPGLTVRLFRRVFHVGLGVSALQVHVSADSRYRLWLNGQSIGFGPAKGTLSRYHFETYDIGPLLKVGRNVLAAEVRWFGEHSPASEVHAPIPGFLFQGPENGDLDTPGDWRVHVSKAVTPDTTPYISNAHQFLGYFEHFDARLEPVGWRDLSFDDSAWARTISLGAAEATGAIWGVTALRTLVPRDVAEMSEYPARFARTIANRQVVRHRFATTPDGWALSAGEGGTVLLETDRYATGFPELTFSGGAGREIRIMYAEALGEWVDEEGVRVWQKGAIRDDFTRYEPHGYRDTLILRGGEYHWEPFYWRAFRFVQIEILPGDAAVSVRDVSYRLCVHPQQFAARFQSSDAQAREIFEVSVNTFRVGAHEIYDDSPYYEQLSYTADTRIEALASLHLCNETALPKRNLRLFLNTLRADGLLDSRVPCQYARQTIPYFCLHWILMLDDYWRWVGHADVAFVRECLVAVDSILYFFRSKLRPDGFVGPTGGWNMVDDIPEWHNGEPPSVTAGGSTYMTCLFIEAMDTAARLHGQAGHPDDAHRWIELGRRLSSIVRHDAWDPTAGLFRESIDRTDTRFSQHVQAGAINAGVASEAQAQRILTRLTADTGLLRARSMQAFYVTRALEKMGSFAVWHTQVLQPWRTFLAQHVTTWPEYPDPARSDSHAWSAWPAIDYITTVLGVRPLAPGWAGVRLSPQTAGLDWAKGVAPSPAGLIRVEWKKRGRTVNYRAEIPRAFPAEFLIPGQEPQRFPDGGEIDFEFSV
jgi:hypothetical protein